MYVFFVCFNVVDFFNSRWCTVLVCVAFFGSNPGVFPLNVD